MKEAAVERVLAFDKDMRGGPRPWNEEIHSLFWGKQTNRRHFPHPSGVPCMRVPLLMRLLSRSLLDDGPSLVGLVEELEE